MANIILFSYYYPNSSNTDKYLFDIAFGWTQVSGSYRQRVSIHEVDPSIMVGHPILFEDREVLGWRV